MAKFTQTVRWMAAAILLIAGVASTWAQQAGATAPAQGNGAIAGGVVGNDAFAAGKPLQEPHDKAAMIQLDAPVDDMMLKSINRRLDIARKAGCTLVVFEVNTYGGQVTSALEISKLIKKLPAEHIHTVAWVHDKAYSAGSLMSAACEQIIMSSRGSIGDCAPIVVANDAVVPMGAVEREKAESPIVQEFSDSAQQNGLNPAILRAMVIPALEVHEMKNTRTGETAFVDTPGKTKLLAEELDVPGGGKEHPWQFVRTVDDDKSLLTVGAADALAMKLSKATVDNEQQLNAAMNIRGNLLVLGFNWAERVTVFLTQTWIRLLLFVAMLVFAWIEISHPGLSVAGVAAVLCLVLLVGAPFLTGLAQVWEIVLIILGLGIILADVFAFGGVGMLAIPGFILMAIGLVASFVPAEPGGGWMPTMNSTWSALERGMGVLVGGTFLAMGAFYALAKYLYLTPGFNRLQLAPAGTALPATTEAIRDSADRSARDAVFTGAIGLAATDLRPTGKARFGEHLVVVSSYGSFINQGTEIEVIEVAGPRVVVKPRTAPSNENFPPANDIAGNPDPAGGIGTGASG